MSDRMFEEPIQTIVQAREYFRAMDGSGYHMWREFPERYEEYKQLAISKQTEMEWRQELFEEYYVALKENRASASLWELHSRMCDLFTDMKTEAALAKILEATEAIRERVPRRDRVIVAETINGRAVRSARSGLIYAAYDLKNIPAAAKFVELSLYFSMYDEHENRGMERCQAAVNLCREIELELGL